MSDLSLFLLLAALAVVIVLQLLALLRPPRVELPPDLQARLQALEPSVQATLLAVTRHEGALTGMAQQLQGFTSSTGATLDSLRHAVDERLAQAVTESRQGRGELLAAFGAFETKLEQRLAGFDASLVQRFAGLQQAVGGRLEESSKALLAHLAQGQADAAVARQELSGTLGDFRTELTATTATLKGDLQNQLGAMSSALKDQLDGNGLQIRHQFAVLQDAVSQQLANLAQGSQQNAEQLRGALNERLAAIQADNTAKLEEMRRTVDEKLHATLEQRLGESFKLVSERLEQVHKGLGEMQSLAGSVGDLKRVMTNVKTRGTWGEMQLGAIIDNVLTPEQYARNVKTVPGSDELVEFAIRLPGRHDEHPVWLPIDSKYPVEHYQRLHDAQDTADKAAIQSAGNAFEASIRLEAKKIVGKYVSPPHTTDFAVLYLPTEGLFAEVMRRPGLVEAVQNDCRVMITGPANLAAMLNSLQMGFKTLAIEKRSSEVWGLLGQVKTEFGKFGQVVEATKKSIDAAAKKFDEVGVRTRAIERKLRAVQELPAPDAGDTPALLDVALGEDDAA